MRVAVLILALCLTVLIGLHLYGFGVGGPFVHDKATRDASDIAVLLAVDLVLGAAFVIGFPRFAALLFVLGGMLAIAEGTTKGTSTAKGAGAVAGMSAHVSALQIWGGAALVLGLLAFAGARELGQDRQAVSDWTPQAQPGSASSGYRARPNPLVPVLAFLFIAALVLVGGGFVNLTGHSGSLGNAAVGNGNGTADETGDDASVEGEGEVDVPPPASADTAFTDASGRPDDAAASEAPAVTKAWLLGAWGPLPESGIRRDACANDGVVQYLADGSYRGDGLHAHFVMGNGTITYKQRIGVDEDGSEDRSDYDQPYVTHVTAIDANTLRKDDATFVRCASL